MGGLSFLTKKNFNPANWSNQKSVWEARQRVAQEDKLAEERAEQLKREREDEQLARAIGGERGGDQAALKFMYGAPPGKSDEKDQDQEEEEEEDVKVDEKNAGGSSFSCERRPGDDAAAARFRMLFSNMSKAKADDAKSGPELQENDESVNLVDVDSGAMSSNPAMKDDDRTALEKAVGRRSAVGLSLEDQIARFPHLKHAPMATGMAGTNVNVTFKPLGTTIRNVRCMACGEWGHVKGERACRKSFNPFALTSEQVGSTSTNSQMKNCKEVIESSPHRLSLEANQGEDSDSSSRRHKKRSSHRKKSKRHRSGSRKSSRSEMRKPDKKRSRSRSRSRSRERR